MKVVILAGGLGSRLQEETTVRPKPMVEIGGKPLLWHLLKHYSHHGFNEFNIALGYLGDYIKQYFLNCFNLSGRLRIDFARRQVSRVNEEFENWVVNLVETGKDTNTGGRVKRMADELRHGTFMLTYGDGLSNVDLHQLLDWHRRNGKIVTLTAVRPPARFGGLLLEGEQVARFTEKPAGGECWINGGFMVCEPELLDYLPGDACSLESHVLERLALEGKLAVHRHDGFWQCMDTLRDKRYLEKLWEDGDAPWQTWLDDMPSTLPIDTGLPMEARSEATADDDQTTAAPQVIAARLRVPRRA